MPGQWPGPAATKVTRVGTFVTVLTLRVGDPCGIATTRESRTCAALPLLQAVLRIGPLRRRIGDRVARQPAREVELDDGARSLAWARVTDVQGEQFQSLWEFPEGYGVVARAVAEVTCRLLAGQGRPGAWFPGELFGLEIAQACGGRVLFETAVP
jgi:hypothetical protein